MTVKIERAGFDHEFFRIGLTLTEEQPDLFTGLSIQGTPSAGSIFEARRVEQWKRFFTRDIRSVVFESSVPVVEALLWRVVDEAVNRPTTIVVRSHETTFSSFPRTQSAGGLWLGSGDRAKGLPREVPVVISDNAVCYGCGKEHGEPIGWRLSVGPFDLPCCPGRGEFDVKKTCRFEALEKLSCCCLCGRRKYDTRGGGRACKECEKLVDEGLEARRTKGERATADAFDGRMSRPLSETFHAVLEAFGAVKVVSYSGTPRFGYQVPALSVVEVESFVRRCGEELEKRHKDGVREGSDLLRGLAEGTKTVAEFNERRL